MGVNSSGVRHIAEAVSAGRDKQIARTVTVLRRTSFALGAFGCGLLALFSSQASSVTFGDEGRAGAVALLSLAVLFRIIAAGQGALLQGMRRIADIVRINVIGALLGSVISIILILTLGEKGIAPSIVGFAAMSLVTSWWYSRKVGICAKGLTLSETGQEAAALLKLGFAFMTSAFLMMGSAYIVRLIVAREIGLDAAGLYSSAWTLAGIYVGYVLQAMGTDFYPQLVGVADDHERCNRLVNDQAHVSLLLAGPGILATLTFAPLVIALFYSTRFGGAVEVLRWICLGMAMRVITWPIGYIHCRQKPPAPVPRRGFWMDVCQCRTNLAAGAICRAGWRRRCVLCLLSTSWTGAVSHCAMAYRLRMVISEHANRSALCFVDRGGVWRRLLTAAPLVFRGRRLHNGGQRVLLFATASRACCCNNVPPKLARLLGYLKLHVNIT